MTDLSRPASKTANADTRAINGAVAAGLKSLNGAGQTVAQRGPGLGESAAAPLSGSPFQIGAQPRRIKILIIEDDAQMRMLLRGCFEHAGFTVAEAVNAEELWAAMARDRFDLITLDVRLPGEGGLELVQSIRQRSDVPVVMISVITNLVDRVTALERGADDFIVKPFDLMDLLARVRAVVRRYDSSAGLAAAAPPARRRYRFDGWVFDAGRRELRNNAGDVKSLTDQELLLLELFVQHPQRELSREVIISHLQGAGDGQADAGGQSLETEANGEPQSPRLRVDMQVSRLRKKLELPEHTVSVIKSVRGVGYVFSSAVEMAGG
jgi:two-component system, OmpR family, response regulator